MKRSGANNAEKIECVIAVFCLTSIDVGMSLYIREATAESNWNVDRSHNIIEQSYNTGVSPYI